MMSVEKRNLMDIDQFISKFSGYSKECIDDDIEKLINLKDTSHSILNSKFFGLSNLKIYKF